MFRDVFSIFLRKVSKVKLWWCNKKNFYNIWSMDLQNTHIIFYWLLIFIVLFLEHHSTQVSKKNKHFNGMFIINLRKWPHGSKNLHTFQNIDFFPPPKSAESNTLVRVASRWLFFLSQGDDQFRTVLFSGFCDFRKLVVLWSNLYMPYLMSLVGLPVI